MADNESKKDNKRDKRLYKKGVEEREQEAQVKTFFKKHLDRLSQGVSFGLGFVLVLLGLFIIAYAGWHPASQIISGVFKGNYTFAENVKFNYSPQVERAYYFLPKNSQFVVNLSDSNCVDDGDKYKCFYEPDKNGDGCPDDMARVGDWCVDKYEETWNCSVYTTQATVGSGGPINTSNSTDPRYTYLYQTRSIAKINGYPAVCMAMSKNHSIPYTTITWYDAEQSCLLAGKTLIPNYVWQEAVVGTPDNGSICNINSDNSGEGIFISNYYGNSTSAIYTGSAKNCKSKYGIYDMIGNVWEWTNDWTDTRNETNIIANTATYGNDIIWRHSSLYAREGTGNYVAGYLRGGDWGDGIYAGAFALNFINTPSDWCWAIGFRCGLRARN